MTILRRRFPGWCPFSPCCGFFLQGGVKALAIINVVCDLLIGLLVSFRFIAIYPYYWGSDIPDHMTENKVLIQGARSVILIFGGYTFVVITFNSVSSRFLYGVAARRDKTHLKNWLLIGVTLFLLWVGLFIIEGAWHIKCGFYLRITHTDIYANVCVWIFVVYKTYAFWVIYSFYKELQNYGALNSALKELSDEEVQSFFQGSYRASNNYQTDNPDFQSQPYKQDFEIPRNLLQIDENYTLGSGVFGTVYKANLIKSDGSFESVAVKTVTQSSLGLRSLLTEVKILSYVGKHKNVVNLIGACTVDLKQKNIYVVVEFCPFGCVMNYLRANRGLFIDSVHPREIQLAKRNCPYTTSSGLGGPTTYDLIKWSMQTASGMEYISNKNVIHGDLAARNVLLTASLDVKIADFGLSRHLYKYSSYIKNSNGPLPWRWMALESLSDLTFSTQSDIWAFGVTLWEYFSCGGTPYALSDYSPDFVCSLKSGQIKLEQPPYASMEIYQMMTKCWQVEPEARPSFAEIGTFFKQIILGLERETRNENEGNNCPTNIAGYIDWELMY